MVIQVKQPVSEAKLIQLRRISKLPRPNGGKTGFYNNPEKAKLCGRIGGLTKRKAI